MASTNFGWIAATGADIYSNKAVKGSSPARFGDRKLGSFWNTKEGPSLSVRTVRDSKPTGNTSPTFTGRASGIMFNPKTGNMEVCA